PRRDADAGAPPRRADGGALAPRAVRRDSDGSDAELSRYRDGLGFTVDFLHGVPPFYGSVSRGAATIHPRFVHDPAALGPASEEGSLVAAYVEVDDVKAL